VVRRRVANVADLVWTVVPSPVGELLLTGDGSSLTGCLFEPHGRWRERCEQRGVRADDDPVLAATAAQLGEYFAGERTVFELPLDPAGTSFRRRVWAALREIPYGRTTSYGEIAARLGLPPGGARAVGLANGANPIPVIVPCHRVIGADGTLTGFGGGIARKTFLLQLERGDALF
jgi:methylated-DNA-[protein]-cysteine S-methyltransferase